MKLLAKLKDLEQQKFFLFFKGEWIETFLDMAPIHYRIVLSLL
ncbi:hypothetical protein LEP1GSC132_2897 [Leptospira kirschneri str. 200803703]|uniref:Uncharacterized protein n=1 Tax=Leptospira kirschneri str. 200802841 TaxID=1193047 RepID=A0A828XXU4_9LEPT|nr:hypothetical protein [Leptospira kirschneri]EKO52380.1 hypothetical protein LEP1GSC131_0266 [Leptospira kirschneri str. 200802841]EMO65733.1 hypothetical protein LEP1GSC132_2897 [Leptospira kirschneri str. 200803703]EMO77643.1 hypothetical protein LEP1GSC127_5019 [Leptospira kirschneri str. 200801925]